MAVVGSKNAARAGHNCQDRQSFVWCKHFATKRLQSRRQLTLRCIYQLKFADTEKRCASCCKPQHRTFLQQTAQDLCRPMNTCPLDSWGKFMWAFGPKPPNKPESATAFWGSWMLHISGVHAPAPHGCKQVPDVCRHGMRKLQEVTMGQVMLGSKNMTRSPPHVLANRTAVCAGDLAVTVSRAPGPGPAAHPRDAGRPAP